MDYPEDFGDDIDEMEMIYEQEMEDAGAFEMEDETSVKKRPVKSKKFLDFSGMACSSKERSSAVEVPAASTSAPNCPVQDMDSRLEKVTEGYDDSKRKFNDIFGDISDIDFEDEGNLAVKKQRLQSDVELIERIVFERNLTSKMYDAKNVRSDDSSGKNNVYKPDITLDVPRYPFITMRSGDDQRLYVRLRSEDFIDKEVQAISATGKTMGLLSVQYETIRREADSILHQIREKRDELSRVDPDVQIVDDGSEKRTSSQLWVEKYKPKRYVDLLSEDTTNRILLQWIKLWDKVVFNREKKVRQKTKVSKVSNGNERPFGSKWNPNTKKFSFTPQSLEELDANGCPQQKLALLCGPPGLGKTTLAHLIACHAGYSVVEMNASDERSPDAFMTALQSATQMRALLGEKRPNCLVIDEIDGAPAPSIELLVKFATGKDTGKARGKKKGLSGVLKRPIICICNDTYVPALRSLRQVAFVVQFPQTDSTRIATRLLDIAREQHIKTDLGTMLALAERSGNDIRSCITGLHFFKTRHKDRTSLGRRDVMESSVGQKDVQKGLFEVWRTIFQVERTSREGDITLAARTQKVLRTVQGFGDYDRLAQGVFENYPQMNIKDSYMEGIIDSCDWLCYTDAMTASIFERQNFSLLAYIPYSFVAHHFNFAILTRPKLTYPSAAYEASMNQQRRQLLLTSLLRGMSPSVRACVQAKQLLMDTLPTLVGIIAPILRPVSVKLFSTREKADLQQVVSVMIDFSLTYTQERAPDGRFVYHLDPNLLELVTFPKVEASWRTLSYANMQLVSQEVSQEHLRRMEARLPPIVEPAPVPRHLQQTLTPRAVVPKHDPAMTRDFFGRMVPCKKTVGGRKNTDDVVKSDIWFQYKEGYSNAVRRKVKIKDLL